MRILSPFIFILVFLTSFGAIANEAKFFTGIQGKWSGPGEIVAGKYKGTKFVCTFDGSNPQGKTGMNIDGSCRVGVFSQPISAKIVKSSGTYSGTFLDGSKGEGMDVTGARYTKNRLIASIKRNSLNGTVITNLQNPNQMKITISVKHDGKIVPVIGMNLKRLTDSVVTGSVD